MKKTFKKLKKSVKRILFSYAKRNEKFRKCLRKVLLKKRTVYYKHRQKNVELDEKTIIFSSFSGRYYSDSPKAIYEYMLSDDRFNDYKFIWVFKKPKNFLYLLDNPNTSLVKANGKKYEKRLIKSKFWIMNYRVADHIYPTDKQVYIQLWHGTPLKRLGYDIKISDNAMNSKDEIRDKYRIDAEKFKYILSPSAFASEKFISAWNLKEVHKEHTVLEDGYPRNDFLVNYTDYQLKEIKAKLGVLKTDKKIILYAPTWRDNQHESGVGYTYEVSVDFDKLRKELEDDYIILFRAHYLVANSFDFEKYEGFIYDVSSYSDINHLYVASDLLITDYSSVFFDYSILKKPIIYYMYDLEQYGGEIRGFYLSLDELPGPIVQKEDELIKEIYKTNDFVYDEKYKKFNDKFNYLTDGKASQRVSEHVVLDNNRHLEEVEI